MQNWLEEQAGFSLIEVLVSIFILSLVAGPFISLLLRSFHDYYGAGERTQATYELQGIMESLLDTHLEQFYIEEFREHPELSQYEYRVTVLPHLGASLAKITVELREQAHPEKVISLVTLKGRRKFIVPGSE